MHLHLKITADKTAPVITSIPADVTVSCASAVPAANTGEVVATDACGGTVTITSADVITAGSCANRFSIARTYTATDACGNSSSQVQTITVNDVTAPVITCPAPATFASVSGSYPTTTNTGNATATDNCTGTVSVTYTDAVNCNPNSTTYTITRTFTATDVCGNVSLPCSQIITVNRKVTDGCFTAEFKDRKVVLGKTIFTYEVWGNNCKDLSHVSFIIPANYVVVSPANGSLYGKNDYRVVTPVSSTQNGIKFEAISKTGMLKNKTCYTFVFTLNGNVPVSAISVVFKAGTGNEQQAEAPCPDGSVRSLPTTAIPVSTQKSSPEVLTSKLTVSAFPNPFTDKVRFTIQAPKAGRATLEVYNMLGQKVGVPFEGQLNTGETRNVEYTAPANTRSGLIYMLRMNGEQVSGKLMSTKQ
jgi:hypothetical protein